jgi:mono/diheme cytochrome c family protein
MSCTSNLKVAAVVLLFVSCSVGSAQSPDSTAAPNSASPNPHRVLVNRYCVACHNERLKTAGLTLDKANLDAPASDATTWEKVLRKLQAGQMPPQGMPQPPAAERDELARYLETSLDASAIANPNPGRRAATHRLNRAEYINTVRDLLALDILDDSLLPADDAGGSFDNIADALTVSPLLMEKYLSAARRISRLAVGNPSLGSEVKNYEISEFFKQDDRVSENLPFGSRGGMAVRHYFPLDGEYDIKIRLQRTETLFVRGIAEPHPLDVRLDGQRLKMFTVGGQHKGFADGIGAQDTIAPDESQADYERKADDPLEFRVSVKAGLHTLGVTFPSEFVAKENIRDEPPTAVSNMTVTGPLEIQGSGDTPSRARIFTCRPVSASAAEEESCAKQILSRLGRLAYRRPLTATDVDELMGLYRQASGNNPGNKGFSAFETGIEMGLRRLLISPEFLFRVERDPADSRPGQPYNVSDLELASRLSFFLWSSIPDDELLTNAEQGKLRDTQVLGGQIRRMLADNRSNALVQNFGGQWLYLRNLKSVDPSKDVFPDFDENLREAFRTETEMFFASLLREDRSLLDLLRADYTFINQRLAEHYGIPGVVGNRFRRVTLAQDTRRGLLGQGSFLTVTSISNRTSPVVRGKWVLENLLGTPPPEPPAAVPGLKEKSETGKVLSMRQQMEQHRANPSCAGCHKLMDPIGFALENFNGIGGYRNTDAGIAIDPTGTMPDGNKISGLSDLRKVLLSRPDQLATTATEKMLTYALGRGLEAYDYPVIRKIVREAAADDYRWSKIILGIVKSAPFQMRRARES